MGATQAAATGGVHPGEKSAAAITALLAVYSFVATKDVFGAFPSHELSAFNMVRENVIATGAEEVPRS